MLGALTLGADDRPSEPRMSLSERAANSTLVVVGTLGVSASMGGRSATAQVKVEEVLFGSIPTNKTLFVSYRYTSLLIPEAASRIGPVKRGSRWILFLTDKDEGQRGGTNYYTRAVGPHMYAHDGFELATPEALEKVRALLAGRTRPNEAAPPNAGGPRSFRTRTLRVARFVHSAKRSNANGVPSRSPGLPRSGYPGFQEGTISATPRGLWPLRSILRAGTPVGFSGLLPS